MSIATQTAPEAPNPLGVEREGKLLVNFAIPCIISMLVTALYNIVDQIFIGQGVGLLGNAATNIAFPLSTACTAIALLLGLLAGRFAATASTGFARTHMRSIIWNAFCRLVTSVVIRVTRPAVEYLSMYENKIGRAHV